MARRSREGEPAAPYRAHAVLVILGVNLVVWLLAGRGGDGSHLASRQTLVATSPSFESFFTYHLLHANGLHLLANMVVILLVGARLETRWGTPKFLLFYLLVATGVAAASVASGCLAVKSGFFAEAPPRTHGASGVALAFLVVLAAYSRGAPLWAGIPMRHALWAAVFLEVAGLALLDHAAATNRSLAGLFLMPQVTGVGFGVLFLWFEPWYQRRLTEARARRWEQQRAEVADIRRRVDRLLDKINAEGMESLTPAEKTFLRQASKHFKRE